MFSLFDGRLLNRRLREAFACARLKIRFKSELPHTHSHTHSHSLTLIYTHTRHQLTSKRSAQIVKHSASREGSKNKYAAHYALEIEIRCEHFYAQQKLIEKAIHMRAFAHTCITRLFARTHNFTLTSFAPHTRAALPYNTQKSC